MYRSDRFASLPAKGSLGERKLLLIDYSTITTVEKNLVGGVVAETNKSLAALQGLDTRSALDKMPIPRRAINAAKAYKSPPRSPSRQRIFR